MTAARLETEWDRTACLLAKIHNVNCAKTHDMIRDPSTLNPMRQRAKPEKPMSIKSIRNALR